MVDKIDSKSDVSFELMHFSQEVAEYDFLDLGVDVDDQVNRQRSHEEEEEDLSTKIKRIFFQLFENEEDVAPAGVDENQLMDG